MMWRSKDHRSAGLWWSLLSSGGCLGGYGRLLRPPRPVDKGNDQLAFHHCLFQLVLIWAAMGDFLVFSDLIFPSPFLSSAAAGAAAADRFFVTEFGVDRWVIHRGPLGNLPWTTGQYGGPASFLLSCS
uniref:Uncharacterized protein n=1 Tax=Fagus sylvatica TaxID=28930 RepID=A0A2N9GBI7_FAGSY